MRVVCLPLCAFFFALIMVLFLALLVHMTSNDTDEAPNSVPDPKDDSTEPKDGEPKDGGPK